MRDALGVALAVLVALVLHRVLRALAGSQRALAGALARQASTIESVEGRLGALTDDVRAGEAERLEREFAFHQDPAPPRILIEPASLPAFDSLADEAREALGCTLGALASWAMEAEPRHGVRVVRAVLSADDDPQMGDARFLLRFSVDGPEWSRLAFDAAADQRLSGVAERHALPRPFRIATAPPRRGRPVEG